MKKIYHSKVGLELVFPIVVILGTVIFLIVGEKHSWIGFAIILPVTLFIIHLFFTTIYIVEDDSLIIKCGLLFHKIINIKTINKITETNNPMSSPATSLDRLEIKYGRFYSILISPKNKTEFINDIKGVNPGIEVHYKKTKSVPYTTTP